MPVGARIDGTVGFSFRMLKVDEHGHDLVSDWFNGKMFHVTADGKATTLLSMKQGTADHAYIPEKRFLILPPTMEDKLTAYELIE